MEGKLRLKKYNMKWWNLKAFLSVIFIPLTCAVTLIFSSFLHSVEKIGKPIFQKTVQCCLNVSISAPLKDEKFEKNLLQGT